MTADGAKPRMSARAEKATRLSVGGILCSVPGFAGIVTDTEWLGYVCVGILLVTILAGPPIERLRGVA